MSERSGKEAAHRGVDSGEEGAPHGNEPSDEVAPQKMTRRARVDAAVERCVSAKKHGEVITRQELLVWFAITYPVSGSSRDFERANLLFAAMKSDFDSELLSEHKMALESEGGGNWRIVHPWEQAELAARTARDAFRRGLSKAQAISSNVDVAQLNDTQRAKLDDTGARLAGLAMFAKKTIPRNLLGGGSEK